MHYIKTLDDLFFGLPQKQLQSIAYEFATKNNICHRFNDSTKLAGEKWVREFRKRHDLSLRKPEQVSVARAMGFNKVQVDRFFTNLKAVFDEHSYLPSRIFNMDETGISTSPNKTPKIVTEKGKKEVCKISSAERGQTVTAVCCFSPTGTYIPPVMIFPRQRVKPELTAKAPYGTLQLCSDSGFINSELFIDWLKHFTKHVQPTKENPVLLILDNHVSHCSIQTIEYCKKHFITLLSLPPHASHRMQPLDRTFFSSLKTAYATRVSKWLGAHPGRVLTMQKVGKRFGQAYVEAAMMEKAAEGFKCTGIYPYNPSVFTEKDFKPSEVTYSE